MFFVFKLAFSSSTDEVEKIRAKDFEIEIKYLLDLFRSTLLPVDTGRKNHEKQRDKMETTTILL
jgi:hypothetical protein